MKPGLLACLALGACITTGDARTTPPPPPPHPSAAAAIAPTADDDPWSLLAGLPPAIDAAAVLDRPGERLWSDPAGLAVRAALSGTGLFAQTERAWSGLASALGYTGDQAAAALLARRVVIAWDGLTRGEAHGASGAAARADTLWIVIAQIDAETARSLRASLNAAPRRTLHGRVVYSVDAGRTAMAVLDDAGQTRVVFAPNAAAGLLDSLLAPPSHAPGSNTTAEQARAMLGPPEPGWTALGMVRLPNSGTPCAMELRTADGAWALRFAAPGDAPAGETDGPPVGVLDRLGPDALLAAAFRDGARFNGATIDLGLRFGMDTPPHPPHPDPESGPLHAGRGGVLVLSESQRADGEPPTLVAQLISHARADNYAETIDRAVSAMVGGTHPPEHRGAFPSAVRSHALRSASPAGIWPGPDARVAWCLAPDEGNRSGTLSVAIAPAGIDPAAPARQGREAWLGGPPGHDPGMVTAGHARPRELARLLAGSDPAAASGLADAMERIEWTVRASDGLTRGEIRVRFVMPGVRLGSP